VLTPRKRVVLDRYRGLSG